MLNLDDINKIIILDFGSQYTQLICRRLREHGIYSAIQPYNKEISLENVKGIILSGSPASVSDMDCLIPDWVWQINLPVLGICYGMQAMIKYFGGSVISGKVREFGLAHLTVNNPYKMPIYDQAKIWMSHGDHIGSVGSEFEVLAVSEAGIPVAVAHNTKSYFGVQYHPEVSNTEDGSGLLTWFAKDICACDAGWQQANIVNRLQSYIKNTVANEKVLLAVSGGVDSTVVAILLNSVIQNNFQAVFVDNGLLRKNEANDVRVMFDQAGVNLSVIDAKERFYKALEGISDPEQKRKIIGKLFIEVFEEYANEHDEYNWLAQGTIYPDIIESAGKDKLNAEVIKSHHNVGGLPDTMRFKLLEPISCLFKDEVRSLGSHLGVNPNMLYRHPFPGPGLAVRIIGAVTPQKVGLLQAADAIFMDCIADLYHELSQAFAVLLPIKSVGVVGDKRAYGYVLALRAVVTSDFMTAESANIPFGVLKNAARKIVNELPEISRVVYDVTDKPPSTIEWE